MNKQELIFDNMKSLKTIASIEAFNSSAPFISNILSKVPHAERSSLGKTFDKFDLSSAFVNQLYQLQLLLKDAEIAVLLGKIEEKSEINSESNFLELTKVNSVMREIKMAVSDANEDISKNKNQELKVSLTKKSENLFSETKLSQEIKLYIENILNKILREDLDSILNEMIEVKKEKKSKVLDLSDVSVTPKITPNT